MGTEGITPAQEVTAAMHAAFCNVSELNPPPRPWAYDRFWFELHRHGYTARDVEIFCRYIKHENKEREERYQRRWHIPKLFGDLAEFDAELTLAHGWARNVRLKLTNKEQAMRELRPIVNPELHNVHRAPARSMQEVLRGITQGV